MEPLLSARQNQVHIRHNWNSKHNRAQQPMMTQEISLLHFQDAIMLTNTSLRDCLELSNTALRGESDHSEALSQYQQTWFLHSISQHGISFEESIVIVQRSHCQPQVFNTCTSWHNHTWAGTRVGPDVPQESIFARMAPQYKPCISQTSVEQSRHARWCLIG